MGERLRIEPSRLLRVGGLFVVLLFIWVTVGPKGLGGSVSHVMTSGNSMEPVFHTGDLVIVRESSDYAVGDIVAARSEDLKAPVLHRIIEERSDRYVTKGDNNDFIDEFRPTDGDILGKRWIVVPQGGKVLKAIFQPLPIAFITAIFGFISYMGFTRKARPAIAEKESVRFERSDQRLPSTPTHLLRWIALPIGALLVYFGAIGFFAFTRPTSEMITRDVAFEQSGRLTYGAKAGRSALYPDGSVDPGDAIFAAEAKKVKFTYKHGFSSDAPSDVGGTLRLYAHISDGAGWQRELSLSGQRSWQGTGGRVSGTLDVGRVLSILEEVISKGGISSSFTVDVRAAVKTDGTLAGHDLDERIEVSSSFAASGEVLRPVPDDQGRVAAPVVEPETVSIATREETKISWPGTQLTTERARNVSSVGMFAGILMALALAFLYRRAAAQESEADRIIARYSQWLVPVRTLESLEGMPAVPTTDIEGLINMADRQGRMAMYVPEEPVNVFFFEQSGIIYFYETEDARARRQDEGSHAMPLRAVPSRSTELSVSKLVEAQEVAPAFRAGASVTVDLKEATTYEARRIMDFLNGLVAAAGGELQQDEKRVVTLIPGGDLQKDAR